MWPFRKRRVGKHELGAAVTAIPSVRMPVPEAVPQPVVPWSPPVPPPAPAVAAPPVPVVVDAPSAPVIAAPSAPPVEAVEQLPAPAVEPVAVPTQVLHPEPAPGMRVELGFRDGSTAALSPTSEQARALSDIADILTKRD